MQWRILFIVVSLLLIIIKLQSCTIEDPGFYSSPKYPSSPAFDTLQGRWRHDATVYIPANGGATSPPVRERDSCQFNPDLTGIDHFPQAPVNFTYNLLPDDSTLIFNTGSQSNPHYDTVIISALNAHNLVYKSKKKNITFPFVGTYYLLSVLVRL